MLRFLGSVTKNLVATGLAGLALLVILFGFYDVYRYRKENECEMTWMYQFPHFMKVSLDKVTTDRFPQYGLYLYAEGEENVIAASNHEYTGIPVLFLPGNSGSHKQVRSFASLAMYKALDDKTNYHFDFYTIDFNEEMSGLYGYILNPQLEFAKIAVDKIMSLYEDHHYIVIIGHSMGGVLAKTLNDGEIKSHLILTLAAPHAHPILIMDPEFDLFYHTVQRNLTALNQEDVKLTTVSVSGGERDLLVSDKISLSSGTYLQTSILSVPGTWISTDHLCILWCKQFVKVVVRILFDLVERSKGDRYSYMRITRNQDVIRSTLDYHLVKRHAGKSIHSAYPRDNLMKPPKAVWQEIDSPDRFCATGLDRNAYYMFPTSLFLEKVIEDSPSYKVVVMTSNTKPKSWLMGCEKPTKVDGLPYCSSATNLSPLGEILPSRKKVAHLTVDSLRQYSHLIVKAMSKGGEFCISMQVYRENATAPVLPSTAKPHGMYHNFSLATYKPRFIAWDIKAKLAGTESCRKYGNGLVAMFRHNGFQSHAHMHNDSLIIRFINWTSSDPHVVMYGDPDCEITLSTSIALLETAGNLFRNYIAILPAYVASILLLTMYYQPIPEEWNGLHVALLKNAFNLTLVPGVLVAILLKMIPTDYTKMMSTEEVPYYLPIVCFFAAFGLVLTAATFGWYALMISGNGLHAVLTKLITKKLGKIPEKVTDFALGVTFGRIPIVIAVLVASLTSITCGGLGICAGLFLYVIKIFKLYEDCMEDLLRGKVKSFAEGLSPLNFHHTLACIWLIIASLNVPSLIHWTRNFGYSSVLQSDISLYISLMLTPVIAILWQDFVPQYNDGVWNMQRYLSYMTAIFIVLWGTHRLYIISFFLTMHLITLAFTQVYSSLLRMAERSAARDERAAIAEESGHHNIVTTTSLASQPEEVPSTSSSSPNDDKTAISDKKND